VSRSVGGYISPAAGHTFSFDEKVCKKSRRFANRDFLRDCKNALLSLQKNPGSHQIAITCRTCVQTVCGAAIKMKH